MRFSSILVSVNGKTPENFDMDSFWGWFIIEEVAKMRDKDITNGINLEFSINGQKLDIRTAFDRLQDQWGGIVNERDLYKGLLQQILNADKLKKDAIEEAAEHFKDKNED